MTGRDGLPRLIDKAVDCRLSFFAYSDGCGYGFGASLKPEKGIRKGGFVIAPFDNDEEAIFTIMPVFTDLDAEWPKADCNTKGNAIHNFPSLSVTSDVHKRLVADAVRLLNDEGGGKTVCARVATGETGRSAGEIFRNLSEKNPGAFTFCFFTPGSDIYVGSSPELLLEKEGHILKTMSLAGTHAAGDTTGWDIKNIEEQALVTDYITSVFESCGIKAECGKTYNRRAANVEHICTPISGLVAATDDSYLPGLLARLSPTPALCGAPRQRALDFINSHESFRRGYYGGYCGMYEENGNFSFHVNLRSARITLPDAGGNSRYALFAGGGITRLSDPETEWEETEKKLRVMRDAIS